MNNSSDHTVASLDALKASKWGVGYKFETLQSPTSKELFLQSAKGIRKMSHYEAIFREWPAAESICNSLCEFITNIPPFDEKTDVSLLDACLKNAVDAWYDCSKRNCRQKEFYPNFVKGLIAELPRLFDWAIAVKTKQGMLVWDPVDQSLLALWQETGYRPICMLRERPWDNTYQTLSPTEIRRLFLYRYLKSGDFKAIRGNINFIVDDLESNISGVSLC